MKFKTIDNKGKVSRKDFSGKILEVKPNPEVFAKYVRVYQSNQRQSNADVKDRSEVSGGGRKPWRQKGTGRARHGSSRSPIWAGGGVTFGPSSEINHRLKINKKEARVALATVFNNRSKAETMFVADFPEMKKTKDALDYLQKAKLDRKITVITNDESKRNSLQNLEGVTVRNNKDISAYDLAKSKAIVFGKEEFDEFIKAKESNK
jgi:large subunit ribosomal protein L4